MEPALDHYWMTVPLLPKCGSVSVALEGTLGRTGTPHMSISSPLPAVPENYFEASPSHRTLSSVNILAYVSER